MTYTDTQLDALDELAATAIMGWAWKDYVVYRWHAGWYLGDNLVHHEWAYRPTRDNNQAAAIRAKMVEDGHIITYINGPGGVYTTIGSHRGRAPTEAIATVIAALRAKGKDAELKEIGI